MRGDVRALSPTGPLPPPATPADARVRELQRVLAGHVGPYPDARGDTLPPPPPEFLAPTTKLK